jgi:hypothetical protein
MLIFRFFWYRLIFLVQKSIFSFHPIVKCMLRSANFFPIHFEILENHSLGIGTAFATKSAPLTHKLQILLQANGPPLTVIESEML